MGRKLGRALGWTTKKQLRLQKRGICRNEANRVSLLQLVNCIVVVVSSQSLKLSEVGLKRIRSAR